MLRTDKILIPGWRRCITTNMIGLTKMATKGFLYVFLSFWYRKPLEMISSPPACINTVRNTSMSLNSGKESYIKLISPWRTATPAQSALAASPITNPILSVSEGRWKIEESFRILKTDFESRPVYVSREDRIRAHFLTCYLALLIYRLLEKRIGDGYTSGQIIQTLREYNLLRINGEGYIPEYTRTQLTDRLHDEFGFRTDMEIIPTRKMKSILALTKK